MPRLKLPTADELFDNLIQALSDDNYSISGNISEFKSSIYFEFKVFMKQNKVIQEEVEEFVELFIEDLIEAMFDEEEPHQSNSDEKLKTKASGSDIVSYQ
jgi:hypothetical protein